MGDMGERWGKGKREKGGEGFGVGKQGEGKEMGKGLGGEGRVGGEGGCRERGGGG